MRRLYIAASDCPQLGACIVAHSATLPLQLPSLAGGCLVIAQGLCHITGGHRGSLIDASSRRSCHEVCASHGGYLDGSGRYPSAATLTDA